MDTVLMLITAAIGWGFAVWQNICQRQDEREIRAGHAAELAARDAKIGQLLDQVQLNSQNMPYYPQIGPFPADTTPEQNYYSDPTGLLVLAEDELTEAAFAEVER